MPSPGEKCRVKKQNALSRVRTPRGVLHFAMAWRGPFHARTKGQSPYTSPCQTGTQSGGIRWLLGIDIAHLRHGVGDVTRFLRQSGNAGFSALELLVAVVIAAILAGAAIPSFLNLVRNSRIDGATRHVLYEIRSAQSLAISRGGVFGFQWGGDAEQLDSMYRVVRDETGNCGFPEVDAPVDGTNVMRGWYNLAGEYPGVIIASVQDANNAVIGGVMFNSRGASVNTCITPVAFPVTIVVVDSSGTQRCVDVQRAGKVSVRDGGSPCP